MTKQGKTSWLYVKYCFQTAPGFSALLVLLRIGLAVLPTVQIGILGRFLQEAQNALTLGTIGRGFFAAGALLLANIAGTVVLENLYALVKLHHRQSVGLAYDWDVTAKQSRLPYALLEDSETRDFLEKVTREAEDRMHDGFCNLLDLMEYALRIGGICLTVLLIHPLTGVLTLALFAWMVPLAVRSGKEDHESHAQAVKGFRRARVFRRILAGQENAAERTLFSATKLFDEKWRSYFASGRMYSQRASRKEMTRLALGSVTVCGFTCLIGGMLTVPLRRGSLTSGTYISILAACIQLSQMICWYAALLIEEFTVGSLNAKDIARFFALPETQLPEPEKGKVGTIEFRDVSFAYPNTQRYILWHMNAVFSAGKSYALVGENGAGKSTLTKLLLGLYDGYEGEILIDGVELRQLPGEKRAGMAACVFQDFSRYEGTVAENLTPGREVSGEAVKDVLRRVGLEEVVAALPQRLDTHLGRNGEIGNDLSGGQWQRLAIARGLLLDRPVLILDEPTASLDPGGEKSIYRSVLEQPSEKLRIFISHRMGCIQSADCIYVLADGCAAESGTHEALMKQNGRYAAMYNAQRSWYL